MRASCFDDVALPAEVAAVDVLNLSQGFTAIGLSGEADRDGGSAPWCRAWRQTNCFRIARMTLPGGLPLNGICRSDINPCAFARIGHGIAKAGGWPQAGCWTAMRFRGASAAMERAKFQVRNQEHTGASRSG